MGGAAGVWWWPQTLGYFECGNEVFASDVIFFSKFESESGGLSVNNEVSKIDFRRKVRLFEKLWLWSGL